MQFIGSYWEKCCYTLLIFSCLRSTEASQTGVNRMAFKLIEKYSQYAWEFYHSEQREELYLTKTL